jgi:hypothetical protein
MTRHSMSDLPLAAALRMPPGERFDPRSVVQETLYSPLLFFM